MHTFLGKKFARNAGVFGGHFEARTRFHGSGVIEIGTHSHTHAALGNLQIEGLIQALAAMLNQGVFAGHAQIGAAILHISGHIGCTHQNHSHTRLVGGQYQFAGSFWIFQHFNACSFQERQRFIKNSSFGQGQGDHVSSCAYFERSICAPTLRNLASMRS